MSEIIDGVFSELGDYFVKTKSGGRNGAGPKFTYPGFGTFSKRKRPARTGRHPQTGVPIDIPEMQTLAFNVGSDLKTLRTRSSAREGVQ